jgi:hypothetical protein
MSTQHRTWGFIGVIGLIVVTIACALPWTMPQATKPTATPTSALSATLSSPAGTATPTAGLPVGGGNGGSDGGTGGSDNNGSSPTQLPEPYAGPYVVKQTETLGGEVISGIVCSVTKPFSVLSVTPRVTFTFYFVPQNAQHGNVSYAYTIPSAGESHDAKGTYTLNPVDEAGTLQLTMAVSDHVVFKGFDGNIPNNYKFNLVPSAETTSCPAE